LQKPKWVAVMLALITGLAINYPPCLAEVQCPWLNATTAGGVLGGGVEMNVTALTPQGDAICDFRRTSESLHIAVYTMTLPSNDFSAYLAQCDGRTIPLKGIGNEAVQCISRGSTSKNEERIIGRVRDRVFVIALKTNLIKPTVLTNVDVSHEIRNIAEQVSGALF
jgi:hypothetical protein